MSGWKEGRELVTVWVGMGATEPTVFLCLSPPWGKKGNRGSQVVAEPLLELDMAQAVAI